MSGGGENEGEVLGALGMAGSPPFRVDDDRTQMLSGLYEGARIHVQHLSTGVAVEAIAGRRRQGSGSPAQASPQQMTLTDAPSASRRPLQR